jgi:hypothetical protein
VSWLKTNWKYLRYCGCLFFLSCHISFCFEEIAVVASIEKPVAANVTHLTKEGMRGRCVDVMIHFLRLSVGDLELILTNRYDQKEVRLESDGKGERFAVYFNGNWFLVYRQPNVLFLLVEPLKAAPQWAQIPSFLEAAPKLYTQKRERGAVNTLGIGVRSPTYHDASVEAVAAYGETYLSSFLYDVAQDERGLKGEPWENGFKRLSQKEGHQLVARLRKNIPNPLKNIRDQQRMIIRALQFGPPLSPELYQTITTYLETRDIVELRSREQRGPARHYHRSHYQLMIVKMLARVAQINPQHAAKIACGLIEKYTGWSQSRPGNSSPPNTASLFVPFIAETGIQCPAAMTLAQNLSLCCPGNWKWTDTCDPEKAASPSSTFISEYLGGTLLAPYRRARSEHRILSFFADQKSIPAVHRQAYARQSYVVEQEDGPCKPSNLKRTIAFVKGTEEACTCAPDEELREYACAHPKENSPIIQVHGCQYSFTIDDAAKKIHKIRKVEAPQGFKPPKSHRTKTIPRKTPREP